MDTNNKNKTILAVWNAGAKGKSNTLRAFANLLLRTYPSYNPIFPIPMKVHAIDDIRVVVEINGVIIGVESQGDPNTHLQDRLTDLAKNYKCDIILCTTRTRGETVHAVYHVANVWGYQTILTSTYQIEDETQHNLVNELKAKHILDLLQSLGLI
ncbi:hypothetical protein E0W68_11145 [Flavobacterium salilacus subsp. salilacus]|uniref:hypothetical protein n=1 Tax=Flavobacterium TaxID=237 RepID=UPI00107523E6|nr:MULTISPECIES: hypothetical protein [Flavobacterium]KAF2517517.1 hypothetical protein E0W68_11145 [Flavobacterium salilacus subsp. salilacus]MBE1615665.1 hypothetical protein [Flavobacterium sp. SaA2.13]